jgi:uncharacterized protein (TIGR02996 family)
MSDEEALLAAIAAHPDEDTPRLAYADWLDEHDRHVRAEFIRVQIEIAQKETLPRVLQNRYVDIWKRNQELIDNHRDDLLGPLAALPKDTKVEFRRGFVSEVQVNVDEFFRNARALLAALPLPRVVIVAPVGPVCQLLGFVDYDPGLDRMTQLVSGMRTEPDGSDGDDDWPDAEAIYSPVSWPRLNELDVSGCRLGNDNAIALLRIETFPALYDLDLSGNDLTDAAVMPLLRSGLPRQLKRLILGGNPITDFGARLLAEQWPTGADDRLEHLNLKFTAIGQPGQQALLRRFGGRIDLF